MAKKRLKTLKNGQKVPKNIHFCLKNEKTAQKNS